MKDVIGDLYKVTETPKVHTQDVREGAVHVLEKHNAGSEVLTRFGDTPVIQSAVDEKSPDSGGSESAGSISESRHDFADSMSSMKGVFGKMLGEDGQATGEKTSAMAEIANIDLDDVNADDVNALISRFEAVANGVGGDILQSLSETLQQAQESEREAWIAELSDIFENKRALVEAKDNPLVRALRELANQVLKDVHIEELEDVDIPPRVDGTKKGIGAVAGAGLLAIGATYLSWAVTRSGASDVLEPYTPMLRDLLAKIYAGASDISLPVLTNIEGGVVSAVIGGVIYLLRGKRFRTLSKTKKALFVSALLASAGLGVYSVQRSFEGAEHVAFVGKKMTDELGKMGVKIQRVGDTIRVLVGNKIIGGVRQPSALERIVQQKIDAEVNNPKRPGFGNDSLTISMVLDDPLKLEDYKSRHEAYMNGEGRKRGPMTESQKDKYRSKRDTRIAIIENIQKKHNVKEGIKAWVARLTQSLSPDHAIGAYDSAVEIAQDAANMSKWEHVLASFSPEGKITPEGMKHMRADAIRAFMDVVKKYEHFRNEELGKMNAYLQDIKKQTGVDMTDVVRDIAQKFPSLPMRSQDLEKMLQAGLDLQDGKPVVLEKVLTPREVDLYKRLPAFMVPSAKTLERMGMTLQGFYSFLLMITLIYMAFDLAIKPIQDMARNRRERLLRDALTFDAEDINDAEEKITLHTTHFVQATLRTLEQMLAGTQKHGMTDMAPDDVVALTVRAHLREWIYKNSFTEEEIKAINNPATDLDMRLKLQNKYRQALNDLIAQMKDDPVNISAGFASEIYPSLGDITIAFASGTLDSKRLERIYDDVLNDLSDKHLGVFEQLLHEQDMSIEDIRRSLRGAEVGDAASMNTVVAEISLDPGRGSITIPRGTSLQAFALAQTNGAKNYLKARIGMLQDIAVAHNFDPKESGVPQPALLSRSGGVASFVSSEPYMGLAPKPDILPERVDDIAGEAEKTEAFNAFEAFMSALNAHLKPLIGFIEQDKDYFDEYVFQISWRLDPVRNYYTIHLGFKDERFSAEQAAGIYYPFPVPDFKMGDPKEIAENIVNWFVDKDQSGENNSHAYRGVVAQLQYFEYRKEEEKFIGELSDVDENGYALVNDVNRPALARIYFVQSILKDFTPDILWLARSGAPIEENKYERLLHPDTVVSAYGNQDIGAIFDLMTQQAQEHNGVLRYNPEKETFLFIDADGNGHEIKLSDVTDTCIERSLARTADMVA